MNAWTPLAEHQLDLPRSEVHAYARTQFGSGLRRAGLSTEFTLATALACWRKLEPPPTAPVLALLWCSPQSSGTEVTDCLSELLGNRELFLPIPFVTSQPHLAALHAHPHFPGLAHASTLTHSAPDLGERLLPILALGRTWTHALVGEVETPNPWQAHAERFQARWRVLVSGDAPKEGCAPKA
jgi:hypothetical protein